MSENNYMKLDEETGQFVLTETALLQRLGIDLRARISEGATINPEVVIGNFLRTVSDMVYQFIHEHSFNNARQDYLITHVASLRNILQRAMEYQAVYVLNVGNLYLSEKAEERVAAIDVMCKSILGTVIPELGMSILYAGA